MDAEPIIIGTRAGGSAWSVRVTMPAAASPR